MLNRLVVLTIAAVVFVLFQFGGVVSSLSDRTLDLLFLLRGPVTPSQEIVIIGVDEASLTALGAWPFQRKYHARILNRLHKARCIGFDILFSEPTRQDRLFNAALQNAPPVVLAAAHTFQNRVLYPSPSLDKYYGVGHIEIILGRDGVVRKTIPLHRIDQPPLPALTLVMLKSTGMAIHPPPADHPVLINHYGPEGTFFYLSYVDVLNGVYSQDLFKDRFVLIGAEALGIGDRHITPLSRKYPTPGVEIQATILNNFLDNSFLRPLQTISWFLAAGICLLPLLVWPNREEHWNLVLNLVLAVLLAGSSILLFRRFLFLNPVPPLFFLAITFLVHLIAERLWTAKTIFREMSAIDRQLKIQLQQVYTNTPPHFFNLQPTPSAGGIRHHLSHLKAGVKILSLQQHFIENLLTEELPPLILWDRHSGLVIIANTMFNVFWRQHVPEQSSLPKLDHFIDLIEKKQPGDQPLSDIVTLIENNNTPAIDIDLTSQGQRKYFRVNMHPLEVADIEFSGVLAVLTDVTEIKELEQLKDEIVSIVSHELKLPLTVILGYGEMLSDSLQDSEKQYIDKICSQARRLNRLIENFLDVARLEHGRREIKLLPLDLIGLIREAANTVSIPAKKKSIEVVQKVPYRVTPIIGDYTLLLQAVINLLDNAIKFSPADTVITIQLTEEINRFILSIADQGPGIPDGSQKEIFDKFNRGPHGSTENGFGLGLNLVLQVVQKHGGNLWLDQETDCGTTFCIELTKAGAGTGRQTPGTAPPGSC